MSKITTTLIWNDPKHKLPNNDTGVLFFSEFGYLHLGAYYTDRGFVEFGEDEDEPRSPASILLWAYEPNITTVLIDVEKGD